MKNKILLFASIFSIIIGISLALVGFSNGGATSISLSENGIQFIEEEKNHKTILELSKEIQIDNMKLDINNTNVTFSSGDNYTFTTNNPYINANYADNSVRISENGENNSDFGFIIDLTRGFGLKSVYDSNEYVLHITIPNDLELIEFTSHKGSLNLTNQEVEALKLYSRRGSLTLNDSNIENSDITLDYGDFHIESSKVSTLDTTLVYGDISVNDSLVENINIDSEFGKINLKLKNNINDYTFDIKLTEVNSKLLINNNETTDLSKYTGENNIKIVSRYSDIVLDFE